ncbi:hypothetical protein [Natrinema gelatinilyticum]|uniref:hypothetical protein n=1 Tax=Natrinema gelatinilyticum TaxID=2961571 RepID=UPI0020C35297|nr:hypothetical protein [Natrinema gelatinilyticum]
MESIIDDVLGFDTADAVEKTELIPLTTAVETAWDHGNYGGRRWRPVRRSGRVTVTGVATNEAAVETVIRE